MTTCRRNICTAESNGDPYCSERCESMATFRENPDAQTEAFNRSRVVNNDRGQH